MTSLLCSLESYGHESIVHRFPVASLHAFGLVAVDVDAGQNPVL